MRLGQALMVPPITILTVFLVLGVVYAQQSQSEGIKLIDAIRLTIAKQPAIRLQEQQVEIDRGLLEAQTGQFDLNLLINFSRDREDEPLTSAEKSIAGTSSTVTETTAYNISLQKLFRTGVSVSPSVETTITDTSPSYFEPEANGRVDFLITLPLMRGLGVQATGANEMSANLIHEASILQLRQTVAQSVLNTALYYWSYRQAKETLDALKDSEARARTILEQVQQLVAGDQVPAADLEQLRASLAQKTSSRIAEEQQLIQARQALGLAMGVSFDQFRSLPLPDDSFPSFDLKAIGKLEQDIDLLLEQSLRNRGDYLASKKIQESAKVQVVAAKNGLKPQIDLHLNLGYQGLDEGEGAGKLFTPLGRNVPGASATLSLSYLFPLENNSAKGVLRQDMASLQQAKIQTADLARNIQSGVQVSLSALKNSALELKRSMEAINYYSLALQNEKDKFSLGTSTLLDVVNMEDYLTSAILSSLSADATYAAAIVQLRFQAGTLISANEGVFSVKESELLGIGEPIKGQD